MKYLLILLLIACGKPDSPTPTYKGKLLYKRNCISCHNPNPSKKGSIGPELTDTPKEVFVSKVTKGTYPTWYSPKRDTNMMPQFNHLTNDAELIYNYVQMFK